MASLDDRLNEARLSIPSMRDRLSVPRDTRSNSHQRRDLRNQIMSSSQEVDQINKQNELMAAMRVSRTRKIGMANSTGDFGGAIPRLYDPMEYWDYSGLPWNMADPGHRHKLHKWMRLYYATHPLISLLVDIFTRFPISGMYLECPDDTLKDYYEELFFDQLDYEQLMVDIGREYWVVGEAFPLGDFDEDLGIWSSEYLINPELIEIENFPMLGTQQFKIKPPEYLKRLVQSQNPAREFKQLQMNSPELIPYLQRGEAMPVSDVILRQIAFKANPWDDHGTPILLRALRTLIHQEKLLASQDAIAERLYSPLILAKLGSVDLGDNQGPWIPGPAELDAFRDDLDLALASDFRLIVHHFGVEVQNVFGREQVPNLNDDFDRIERQLMQVFGVNPSLLSAGSNSQPYASSALQAEFMNQILRTYQGFLKKHFRERAMVVAEAQGHYAYDKRGQTRVPIYENVKQIDDEGNVKIVRKRKLLIPKLEMSVLDMRDEATERVYRQQLRAMGYPVSDRQMSIGITKDWKDSLDEMEEEMIMKTLATARAKKVTYERLVAEGLPIPPDLATEMAALAGQAGGGAPAPDGGPGPAAGSGPGNSIEMPPVPADLGGSVPGGGPPVTAPIEGGPAGPVPEISNERRPGLTYNTP